MSGQEGSPRGDGSQAGGFSKPGVREKVSWAYLGMEKVFMCRDNPPVPGQRQATLVTPTAIAMLLSEHLPCDLSTGVWALWGQELYSASLPPNASPARAWESAHTLALTTNYSLKKKKN